MSDATASNDLFDSPHTDARGHAALLLVESLIHGLIEKELLSVTEAIEIVDVATEVNAESTTEMVDPRTRLRTAVNLLQDVSASLRFDIVAKARGGTRL